MLNIPASKARYCDGVSRRNFLRIGSLSFGAASLSLADVYRAEAAAGTTSHKAVINIFLGGGPAHQDMWDLKMEAPDEIRGEFKPIQTRVPGIQIGEVFPRLAGLMHKSAIIRSIVGASDRHDAVQCLTGWPNASLQPLGGRPSIGSVISKVQGPVDPSIPSFVGLAAPTQHKPWGDAGQVGFLGPAHAPFKPDGPGLSNLTLNSISADRFDDRKRLLKGFDNLRRDIDAGATLVALDAAQARALDVLTSNKLLNALDVSREPARVRERYGDGKPYNYQFDGAPTVNDQVLMARRLVEAGVRCVTLTYGRWDAHSNNFNLVRDHGSKLDQCVSALIEDLDQRGMLDDVSVVVWGEFGRTPRINGNAGRDHWPQVSAAFLAGGGMKVGQAIGSTNRLGEYAVNRPTTQAEVLATLYKSIGINVHSTTITDPTGRPQYLVDAVPMPELV